MPDQLIDVPELAKQLNLAKQSIYNAISKNAKTKFPIRAIRIGGAIRFSQRDVNELIEKGGCKK